MSAPAAHDTAAEQDPIEGVVKNMHIVLPVAGAVLIRFNAAIAGLLAGSAGPAQAAPGAPQAELPLPGAADAIRRLRAQAHPVSRLR